MDQRLFEALSRRRFLGQSLAGAGLAALGPRALTAGTAGTFGAPATQPFLVVVNLRGGNDGLNTVVPVQEQEYYDQRPDLALPENTCLDLAIGSVPTTRYRLHPSLMGMQGLWADGDLAIVNKVGYPDPNRSHFESEDIWSWGVRGAFGQLGVSQSGWIARYASLDARDQLGAVSLGMGRPRSFVGGTSNPLTVGGLGSFDFDRDWDYQRNHDYRLEVARQVLERGASTGAREHARTAALQAHELADGCQQALDNYTTPVDWPTSRLAQRMRDIAVMLQAGFGTRVFYTGTGGYDTHAAQGRDVGRHANLLADLDGAIAAFAADMRAQGLWDLCAIVVISEFGRRVYQNGSGGTDHGAGNCLFVAGGGVNGGIHGADITAADFADDDVPYAVDFRDVYRSVLRQHLVASDVDAVFPEAVEVENALALFG